VAAEAWPLVGRVEELAFVTRALDGGGVIVTGAAGVGKSRLAREAAERSGLSVFWVVATTAARTIPFGAFSALLPVDLVGASASRVELLIRLSDQLAEQAAQSIVFVDDAHLLDDLSAALLHRMVLDRRVTVVITVRSGEPVPDSVTSLWKEGVLDRLELHPLSELEVSSLVEAALGAPVEHFTRSQLWSTSAGNALFLRELLLHAFDQGAFTETDGVWRSASTSSSGASASRRWPKRNVASY
jgi:predicted ATPase